MKSKNAKKDVEEFIQGFSNCSTYADKKRHLVSLGSKKIPVDEQVKALLCHFLEEQKLGYVSSDTTAKTACHNAAHRVVQSLLFLRKNIASIRINNESIISSRHDNGPKRSILMQHGGTQRQMDTGVETWFKFTEMVT